MGSRDVQKEALLPPPLTMVTWNLVSLKKTSEMSPTEDEFVDSYSKQNLKKSAFKLSIDGPILLVFVRSSQILFEELLVIAINKIQSFSYN